MLPNCIARLTDALRDIESWLEENGEDQSVNEAEEKPEAQDLISTVKEFINQLNAGTNQW